MAVIGWIVFGLAVGLVAKLLTPGRDVGSFVITTILGVLGAMLGGLAGRALGLYTRASSVAGVIMAGVGAVALLAFYNAVFARREIH
jgi:uncharacterized membrane protein YeaQ/YmgE (transglycosylase-associated protein family)